MWFIIILGSDILNKFNSWCNFFMIKDCATGLYIRQEVDGGVNFVMNECMLSNLVHRHDQSTVSIRKCNGRLPVVRKSPAIHI